MRKKIWPIIGMFIVATFLADGVQATPSSRWKAPTVPVPASVPCPDPDPYESAGGGTRDDSHMTASDLEAPAGQPGHTFDLWSDKDWAVFDAEVDVRYTISTSNLTPPYDPEGFFADTVLELFGSDGVTMLEQNDDFGGTYASQIDWIAPESGTYYVKVYNYNSAVFGCEVGYDLDFEVASTPQTIPLDIEKSVQDLNGEPLYEGDLLRYTVTVDNPSQEIVRTGVVITDAIPTGTTVLPNSVNVSATGGDWTVVSVEPVLEVTGDALAPQNSVTINFEVQVNGGTAGQTITNQAHVIAQAMAQQSTPPVTTPSDGLVFPDPDPGPGTPTIFLPIITRNE